MKRRLDIDWDHVFGRNGDGDEPPAIVIVTADAAIRYRAMSASQELDIRSMRDDEIEQTIERDRSNIEKLASKLPDKGAKFRARIELLQEERSRHRLLSPAPSTTVVDGVRKSMRLKVSGDSDCFREEGRPSISGPDSSFASILLRNMEENVWCRERQGYSD